MMEIIIVEHILILDVLKLLILIIIIQTTHKIIKNLRGQLITVGRFFISKYE